MSIFPIEKNVAMPERKNEPGKLAIYPFTEMAVGDSFFVPYGAELSAKERTIVQARIHSAANHRTKDPDGKRNGKHFTVRQMVGGVRCWRIA